MRQTATKLNRGWLAVIGVITLLAGVIGLGLATGQAGPVLGSLGLGVGAPDPQSPVLGGGWDAAWVAPVVIVVGLVLALLGLAWLIAQIPRANQARPFRLHDSADSGQTWCSPQVLTDAVEAQTAGLDGVRSAAAVLRGTADRPELTVKVTASDRTDIARLVQSITTKVSSSLGAALDTQVARLGVQVEIDRESRTTRKIVV